VEASPYRRFKGRLQNYWNLLTHLGWDELRGGADEKTVRHTLFARWANSFNHFLGEHEHCMSSSSCHDEAYQSSARPLVYADRDAYLNVIFKKLRVHAPPPPSHHTHTRTHTHTHAHLHPRPT
jgi:hypothetical protein